MDNHTPIWSTNPENFMRFENTCVNVVEISWNTPAAKFEISKIWR